jgi:hypothetical protein
MSKFKVDDRVRWKHPDKIMKQYPDGDGISYSTLMELYQEFKDSAGTVTNIIHHDNGDISISTELTVENPKFLECIEPNFYTYLKEL